MPTHSRKIEPLRIHIGHGEKAEKGFQKFSGDPDGIWSNYEAGSVEEFLVTYYIHKTSSLKKFMENVYMTMKKGGKATIVSPYWNSARAWQDPDTKRAISEVTFLYFNSDAREANGITDDIKADFDIQISHQLDNDHIAKSTDAQGFAVKNFSNACHTLIALLTKK
jgi:hypothetical protein